MKRVLLVARRELMTRLHQRSYLLTMIFQTVLVAVVACLPVVSAAFSDNGPVTSTVLVVDADGTNLVEQLAPYIVTETDMLGEANVVELVATAATEEEAANAVGDGDADAALIASRDADGNLAFTYVNDDGSTDGLAQQLFAGAAAISMEDRLARSGIDEAAFEAAMAPPAFALTSASGETVTEDDEIGGIEVALSYFFTILMFMAILLYGSWVAQGVVEEKSSRIMEIMINAATPRDLLAGKVLGIGAAGLLQMLPMLLVGGLAFGLQRPIARLFDISTESLPEVDFGAVSVSATGWFLVYFLLGFTLYAAMYAGLGSLVSRQEEVNQAIAPMQTISIIGYIAAFLTMWIPDALISRILSIFPLTSPFTMVSRMIVGDPPAWEVALSVALLFVTMVAAILLAARIYRVGVLLYGQKPSLRAVFSSQLTGSSR